MSSIWLKNLCGSSLDDAAMKDIPNPTLELGVHVTIKTVQAFGLLGTVLVGPIVAAVGKETRNMSGLKHNMTRVGRGGLILGLGVGPLLTYLKLRTVDDPYKVWDRCYRLRYNRSQVFVDQASFVGGVAGVAAGASMASGALFGGLVGMSSGILAAAVYNNAIRKEK